MRVDDRVGQPIQFFVENEYGQSGYTAAPQALVNLPDFRREYLFRCTFAGLRRFLSNAYGCLAAGQRMSTGLPAPGVVLSLRSRG